MSFASGLALLSMWSSSHSTHRHATPVWHTVQPLARRALRRFRRRLTRPSEATATAGAAEAPIAFGAALPNGLSATTRAQLLEPVLWEIALSTTPDVVVSSALRSGQNEEGAADSGGFAASASRTAPAAAHVPHTVCVTSDTAFEPWAFGTPPPSLPPRTLARAHGAIGECAAARRADVLRCLCGHDDGGSTGAMVGTMSAPAPAARLVTCEFMRRTAPI